MNEALQLLREQLLKRQAANPSYSHNAFARDLGVSKGYLSLILSGKRPLSLTQAGRLASLLKLSAAESERFIDSIRLAALEKIGISPLEARAQAERVQLEVDRFKCIQDWYHVAILDLTTLKNFQSDVAWIAGQLSISTAQTVDALERLERLGLLKKSEGIWKKTGLHLSVPTERSEASIREHHRQMMKRASEEMDKVAAEDFFRREISSLTLAVDPKTLDRAKVEIKKLKNQLTQIMCVEESTELYQLNIQLFPLTVRRSS